MVLPRWLHVTVLHAGPQASATDAEIAAMTEGVRKAVAGTGPITLTFSRPSIGTVGDRSGSTTRCGRSCAVGRDLDGHDRCGRRPVAAQPETYTPHLTIAYAGSDAAHADRSALKAELSDIDAGEVTLEFPVLTLVSQWHNHRRITWEPLATVPLR
ncbi:2'-5' RNA ligase family protein [Streptomyces niveus]